MPLQEDLRAALLALEEDDYENMNIFANRVMSDATITSDNRFLLIGFFLKDVAIEMMELTSEKKATALATAKAHVNMFAAKMKEHTTTKDFAPDELWKEYVALSDALRKFHFTPFEEKAYNDHKDFTHKTALWLLELLTKDRDALLARKNLFLKGILNELGRTYRVHGADKSEIMLLSLLTAFDRFHDYVVIECEAPDGSLHEDKMKERIFPYVDQISEAIHSADDTKVSSLLCDLIVKWRLAFIRYMEIQRVVRVPVEKGVQIPEETKKKISEAVTKALEVKEKSKK